jgi:predicted negative regulator of RcsB-dependent stress response
MDGLPLLNEAMEVGSASSDKIFISEVLALKGDLMLAISSDNAAEAESWYQIAVDNARDVHAPMLELRAAIRLSRVWKELGKPEQARKLLSDSYAKITEGLTTADLKEASTLLTELSE